MSFANSLRTVRAYASAVSTQIGVGLAAALRHVLILLRTVLKAALRLAQGFAKVMESIFGKYTGSASALDTGLIDSEDYAGDLADAVGDASGGLGDAADAAEKLQKELSVLPFDELNQLNKDREDTSSGTGGTDTGGDASGLGDGIGDIGDAMTGLEDMIDNSLIPGKIQKWIDRIKAAFQAGNWFALGRDIAGMLNDGIQGIYNLLDPETVKERVEPYIWAFAATFNSLVDNLNFDLMGRTIARGINDIAYIFNSWYEKMNFERLGQQLSNGLNGLLTEGDFLAWGQALGNKFMIAWDIFAGFVSNEEMWHNLGKKLADGVRGLNNGIRLNEIGGALADFANGLCTTLADFAENAPWGEVVDNLVGGINTFIERFEWKNNGQKINKFITKLVDAIVDFLDRTNWEDFGKGLADTLAEIEWATHLKRVAEAILKALGELIKGLGSTSNGKIALALIGIFGALKIAASIAKSAIGSEIIKGIAKSIVNSGSKKVIGDAISTAASNSAGGSGAAAADAALGAAVGGGLLLTGLVAGAKRLSEFVDVARGGNGVITGFGTAVDSLSNSLVGSNKITAEQARELFNLKEAGEQTGASQQSMAQGIIAKLGEWGLSADSLKLSIDGLAMAGNNEASAMGILSQAASEAALSSDNLSNSQLLLNGQSVTTQQAISGLRTALFDASLESSEFAGQYDLAREVLSNSATDIHSANEAYRIIINSMGEGSDAAIAFKEYLSSLGYSFEETEKKAGTSGKNITTSMGQGLSNFAPITKSVNGIKDVITTTLENAHQRSIQIGRMTASDYGNAYANRSELATHLAGTMADVSSAFSNINSIASSEGRSTIFNYGQQFANRMELNAQLSATQSDVTTKFEAIRQAAESAGEGAKAGVLHGLQKQTDGLSSWTSNALGVAATTANGIKSTLDISGDMYWIGSNAGRAFANGFSSVRIPMPHVMVDWWDIGFGMQVPMMSVSWYKAGGFFKGGNGQVIGIGEDNRDEAVLPLENRKAMSAIADSIVSASNGSMGISADDIADAVVQAMVMTQSSQNDPIFHIEVKTEDNEVLARAVTRGQRSIDYRNNPTPKLAY